MKTNKELYLENIFKYMVDIQLLANSIQKCNFDIYNKEHYLDFFKDKLCQEDKDYLFRKFMDWAKGNCYLYQDYRATEWLFRK